MLTIALACGAPRSQFRRSLSNNVFNYTRASFNSHIRSVRCDSGFTNRPAVLTVRPAEVPSGTAFDAQPQLPQSLEAPSSSALRALADLVPPQRRADDAVKADTDCFHSRSGREMRACGGRWPWSMYRGPRRRLTGCLAFVRRFNPPARTGVAKGESPCADSDSWDGSASGAREGQGGSWAALPCSLGKRMADQVKH